MKKKTLLVASVIIVIFVIAIYAMNNQRSEEVGESVTKEEKNFKKTVENVDEDEDKNINEGVVENKQKKTALVSCGEEYNAGKLSYNILSAKIENGVLRLKMEVFNNSAEEIDYTPFSALTVFNDNDDECSWDMTIGKLNGQIMPNSKIVGEAGFDIQDLETANYILHIGESFEYIPAIKITNKDIARDAEYDELFKNSSIASEYVIGVPVKSAGFDMLISGVSKKPSKKEGEDILLIDLSITNNDSEERTLGFEIKGVYTENGDKLSTEYSQWTFRNYGIEGGETATGVVSYSYNAGETNFYMVVAPDIKDFSRNERITFSVE